MIDTIYALSTPPGQSGIAVVRVSGPKALAGLSLLSGRALETFSTYKMKLVTLTDPVSRETIDQAMAAYFAAPGGFTGEGSAEYFLHGGVAVVDSMLSALASIDGYRMAEPGEFTRRAFENGKLDLTEAEAVADLIHAETSLQKKQALDQLGGALSKIYESWAETLTRSLAHIEADLEFPDEDLPDGVMPQVVPKIEKLIEEISEHLDDNRRGERMRDGVRVAVIGAPNAGKSSLVNSLAQRDVAIVSPHEGTTRDIIDVHLNLGGYPVILSDTAGLRPDQIGQEGQEGIESEGIRRALQKAEEADIKMLVFDAEKLPQLDAHSLDLVSKDTLIVFNKCENLGALPDSVRKQISECDPIMISVNENRGIEELLQTIIVRMKNIIGRSEAPSLTRQRHREALLDCKNSLNRSLNAAMPELVAEDVRLAVRSLGRITGRVDVEDLLDVIFRDFCIGK
jgi:tRNA modification GTPase